MAEIIIFHDMDQSALGQRLRAARQAKRISRATLGVLAEVPPRQIATIEAGRMRQGPTISTLYKLAQALGVSLDSLVGVSSHYY